MKINLSSNEFLQAIEDFKAHLSLEKTENTIKSYGRDVSCFLSHLEGCGIKRLKTIKPAHISNYIATCKKVDGASNHSLNRYFMSIRMFLRYLKRLKKIDADHTADMTAPKLSHTPPRVPTRAEIHAILNHPDTESEYGIRDRAILELMYSSGLRASEICGLNLRDIQSGEILVRNGKGGKTRTVPMTEEATAAINRYLDEYRGNDDGCLFQLSTGKPLQSKQLHKIVTMHARKAHVHYVTPHSLRHACATHLLEEGADLRLIQEILGHASVATTQQYTQLSSARIKSMFNKFHPRTRDDNG